MPTNLYSTRSEEAHFLLHTKGSKIHPIVADLILGALPNLFLTLLCFAFCISKSYSQLGQAIEWQKTIGGSSLESIYSIQQTSDGGYFFGGASYSNASGDKTEDNWDASADYWIVKTDSIGNIQWQNTIGGYGQDDLRKVLQTFDGGYLLAGFSMSDSSGDKTENHMGFVDIWLVKTDTMGNIQWQNNIGTNSDDQLAGIEQTVDGGYIILCNTKSNISGDKTVSNWDTSGTSFDLWIIKIDAWGNIQWQKDIGTLDNDGGSAIEQTSDGGYIIGGGSASNISGDKTENSCNGSSDCWLIKTDSLGDIEWQNTIGGSSTDYVQSLHQTTDGGYILACISYSDISCDKTENSNGDADFWLVKTDASGNLQWQNTIGGSLGDYLNAMQQTTDGGYILCGSSYSNASSDKTENSLGDEDYWVVKTDSAGNIEWQNTFGGSDIDRLYAFDQTNDGEYVLGGYSWSNASGYKTEDSHGSADFWIVKLTDSYSTISGNIFIDANSNGVHDAGEVFLPCKRVTESNTGQFVFSFPDGNNALSVLDTGNFTVYPETINYYNPVPITQAAYFSSMGQTDLLNDFSFQAAGTFNDLAVHISPMGSFNVGFSAGYFITFENVGTTTLSPDVVFFPDSSLMFVSSSVNPTSVTSDSVVWSLGSLEPFHNGSILVTVKVDSETVIGTLISSEARIAPVSGDATTDDNLSSWDDFAQAALDPNGILVDRQTILTTELASPPYLEYIIYFQNTGNDTAVNVRVQNKIPDNLDVNSFEFVASSHPVSITYNANEALMTFAFNNILLPSKSVNKPRSHGFIRYRIKPFSTLGAGDSIKNAASIYFDFNLPVQTNTAVTEIVIPTGVDQVDIRNPKSNIFPNPAKDEVVFNITSNENNSGSIKIFNAVGQVMVEELISLNEGSNQFPIDVSFLTAGIYFVEIQNADVKVMEKLVKE